MNQHVEHLRLDGYQVGSSTQLAAIRVEQRTSRSEKQATAPS
jgi:hypothetical protein